MDQERHNLTRRDFLRSACAAGAGALALPGAAQAADAKAAELVPTRVLGKTGLKIPILGLGGEFNIPRNQIMLKQAHKLGVRYWDTSPEYEQSEAGYGMFLEKNPDLRKEVILSTKTAERDPQKMTASLEASLQALKTDCVDLFLLHRLEKPDELLDWGDQWKAWAEKAKKDGKIKFFGASFHDNVMENLVAVAKTGWMDVAMFLCNYRVLNLSKMKRGLDAAEEAKLGTIAIKVQALRLATRPLTPAETEAVKQHTDKGYSAWQAKLKLLWDSPRIHTACCLMTGLAQLNDNAAAAVDKTKLSQADRESWRRYAEATCSGYCVGCGAICSEAVRGQAPVRDIVRLLTYHTSYGDRERARRLFAALPADVRGRLAGIDYSRAEAACPQGLPIARLMEQAARVLA